MNAQPPLPDLDSPQDAPLATKLRPTSLETFVGQQHLVGEGKPLRQVLERNQLFSMIFWGPPGVGKTTLARILAAAHGREFIELSAVRVGKSDVREVVEAAKGATIAPVLFLDEIHRFNKAQQDFLLPYVEDGTIILIGATTENPSFEVNPALLSRSRVFVLKELTEDDLRQLIENALAWYRQNSPELEIVNDVEKEAVIKVLLQISNGDARQLLNLIETTVTWYGSLSEEHLQAASQQRHLRYDQNGEEHYNTISAFIKSMRASNVDAALYYLARMVDAGEDPQFIARRMVIFASEDVGMAQPTALVVANAVFEAVSKVGYPEAQISLAHGATYLSLAKKNRSAYDAYFAALADVQRTGNLPIPLSLRNAPTKFMKGLGYGKNYSMYPDKKKSLLPDELSAAHYYQSSSAEETK